MTTKQQTFAEAFSELVALAAAEPFVPLTSIGARSTGLSTASIEMTTDVDSRAT